MITLDQALEVAAGRRITSLKTGAMGVGDVMNLILQRSEIIRDQDNYNSYIKSWTRGDDAPLLELIDRMGAETLIQRAAAFIYLEYMELSGIFAEHPPQRVADIGCGYAIFDLFLAQEYDCDLVLIDLEQSDNRHFGFKREGAAYSNLEVAARFLRDNGVAKERIRTLNPATEPVEGLGDIDLAVSFISCGFHYPWQTYEAFFRGSVQPGGRIILDIRLAKATEAKQDLAQLGEYAVLDAGTSDKAVRAMVTTPG